MKTRKRGLFCIVSVIAFSPVMLFCRVAPAQEQGKANQIVADQVRSQGFVCESPSFAVRMTSEWTPEQPAYLLTCQNATYQVRVVPDQAARVIKVK